MLTRRSKITLALLALLVGVYGLLRLGFLIVNRRFLADASAGEVALAFVHGLRFDVAALLMINAPLMVLWNVHLPRVAGARFRGLCFALFALLNVPCVMLNVADYGYYPNVQRRLLYEPFENPRELASMVPQWFTEFPLLCAGVLAAGAAFVVLLKRLAARVHARVGGPEGPVLPTLASGGVLIALSVLGIRGGLQEGILRTADAFKHSSSSAVGYLTLNTTYTVLLSGVLKPLQTVRAMPEAEAVALVHGMLGIAADEAPDPRHPFRRATRPTLPVRRRNVMLILMESWTWANVGPHEEGGRTLSRTPRFDALCAEGLLFTNFLASGQKSNEAIPSLITSVPSVFRRPVIGSRQELTRFRGLGSIVKEHGWATSFHYGAEKTIMGFDAYGRLAGFDAYRSEEDYPDRSERVRDGRWGIFDHLFYDDTLAWLDRERAPFLTLLFSLSPHDPYKLPPDLEDGYAAYAHETGYQRCLRYSDWALGRLFDQARTRPWFGDTIFLITADHTRFSPPNSYYESFHVPLLLLAPGLVPPGRNDRIGFHPDLLPTVLDLLQLPAEHASMGRSLLDPREPRYAVVFRDQGFGIFDGRHALLHDLRQDVGLFDYRADPTFARDLSASDPAAALALRRRLLAYLQTVTTSVTENRVWPAGGPR